MRAKLKFTWLPLVLFKPGIRSGCPDRKSRLIILIMVVLANLGLYAQDPTYETVITYSVNTRQTDKPIPFDKAFILKIENLNVPEIDSAIAFEYTRKGKKPDYATTRKHPIFRCKDTLKVFDATFKVKQEKDQIQIEVPALRPNKEFVIQLVTRMSKENKAALIKIANMKLNGDPGGEDAFNTFLLGTVDDPTNTTASSIDYKDIGRIFNKSRDMLTAIAEEGGLKTNDSITVRDLKAITNAGTTAKIYLDDLHYLTKVVQLRGLKNLQNGKLNLLDVYKKQKVEENWNLPGRLANLDAALGYFDSLSIKMNRINVLGITTATVNGTVLGVDSAIGRINSIRENLLANRKSISGQFGVLSEVIDSEKRLRQNISISGNNFPSDLKTEGNNHFMLSLGFANIWARNVTSATSFRDKYEYIPKLYTGLSFYFRPVDKNTRRYSIRKKSDLSISKEKEKGPDGDILARRTVWRHLALNLGLTYGDMRERDFDNLLSGTSLLFGPSCRLYSIITVSAGVSFMRRTSFNPLISEKKFTTGVYVGLAFDIDFIQAGKDLLTSFSIIK